jgi:hypothetical protein
MPVPYTTGFQHFAFQILYEDVRFRYSRRIVLILFITLLINHHYSLSGLIYKMGEISKALSRRDKILVE